MSHFTELKTNLKVKRYLQKALKSMGFCIEEESEGVEVRGFFDEVEKAEFKILTSTKYDIGFRVNEEGCYEVVGDWDILPKASKIDKEVFISDLKRTYAKTTVEEIAKEKGYELELNEDQETGNIEMVLSQW